jgi:hypothetical protein
MKRALITFCVISIIMMTGATNIMAGQNEAGADVYNSLVNKLKNNDLNVDFQALRFAYTKTENYKPYGGDDNIKDAAFDALKKKNYPEAVRQAQSVLERNYVDLDVHLLCRTAYRETGNLEKYTFHSSILKGLVGSLYASGDGTAPEKAIIVISVSEEYFIMNANGLKSIKNTTFAANGHNYDKIDVENKKTAEKKVIYFNIDIPYNWLTKNLKQK